MPRMFFVLLACIVATSAWAECATDQDGVETCILENGAKRIRLPDMDPKRMSIFNNRRAVRESIPGAVIEGRDPELSR